MMTACWIVLDFQVFKDRFHGERQKPILVKYWKYCTQCLNASRPVIYIPSWKTFIFHNKSQGDASFGGFCSLSQYSSTVTCTVIHFVPQYSIEKGLWFQLHKYITTPKIKENPDKWRYQPPPPFFQLTISIIQYSVVLNNHEKTVFL